jgi:hypothetical protein
MREDRHDDLIYLKPLVETALVLYKPSKELRMRKIFLRAVGGLRELAHTYKEYPITTQYLSELNGLIIQGCHHIVEPSSPLTSYQKNLIQLWSDRQIEALSQRLELSTVEIPTLRLSSQKNSPKSPPKPASTRQQKKEQQNSICLSPSFESEKKEEYETKEEAINLTAFKNIEFPKLKNPDGIQKDILEGQIGEFGKIVEEELKKLLEYQ